jgi:hypothetical protein
MEMSGPASSSDDVATQNFLMEGYKVRTNALKSSPFAS